MNTEKQNTIYLNANDVCKLLKIGRTTFVKLCKEGLPRIQMGPRTFRYVPTEVEAWIKQRRAQ